MDDTPDKVRRNLLVYCGALLIGWYLDIDFKTILNVPGFNLPNLAPFKTTVVSLVILCYLMARFSHSKEYKDGGDYKIHFKNLPHDLVIDFVAKGALDYSRKGRESKRALIFDWADIDVRINFFKQSSMRFREFEIKIDFGRPNQPSKYGVGTVPISGSAMILGVRHDVLGPEFPKQANYKIPSTALAMMKLKTFWRMVLRDEHFVSAKLPVLLGLITYCYLLIKLMIISAGL